MNDARAEAELQSLIDRAWHSQILAPRDSLALSAQAKQLALARGDELSAAHAELARAVYEARRGDFVQAEASLHALGALFARHQDKLGLVRVNFCLTIVGVRQGTGETSYTQRVALLDELEQYGEPFDALLFHNALGSDSTLIGRFDTSLRHYFLALAIARDHGFYDCEAMILSNIGDAQHECGNDDDAIDYLEQAYKLVKEYDVKPLLHAVINNLATSLLAVGAHERALALIESLLQHDVDADSPRNTSLMVATVPSFMALAAQAYAMAGQWARAEAAIEDAKRGAAIATDIALWLKIGWTEGNIEYGRGNLTYALASLERAASLLEQLPTPSPKDAVRIFSGLANTHAALGNWEAAYTSLSKHRLAYDQLHSSAARARVQTAQIHAELAKAERERDQAKLRQLEAERERAYTDPLTGLANRERLRLDGDAMLARGVQPLVLLLNVKRFRAINGLLGQEIGDAVLIHTGKRLASIPGAEVGRLHADRFCLIWPFAGQDEALYGQIMSSFAAPLHVDEQRIDVDLAIGVARAPMHGDTMSSLMRNAEIALHANRHQRVEWTEYTIEHESGRRADLDLLSALRQAVESDELRLYLQPKVRTTDGRVSSAEALVRWQHPTRGLVPPADFIPFAEQIGGISQLTHWMLREAMHLAARLQANATPLQISVNLSTHDLRDPSFVERATALAVETGADPASIRLEVTESGVMDDPAIMLGVLHDLHAAGFTLSIDDFGTGHSSLAYLQKMPVSELKIDRAFVKGIAPGSDGITLLESIISLAHRLGLSIVAEGAETAGEWALLSALGCDYVQGWYAAKPMPVADFLEWRLRNDPFAVPGAD
jgi:diguanylate cyclase (GGDEF)-like protein